MIIGRAIHDVIAGAKSHDFWITFGLNSVKAKYRRTVIGQWWITLSVATFIFVIGSLYQGIVGGGYQNYMAYLAVGYILWLFMQECISSGSKTLNRAKPFLLQKRYFFTTFFYELLYRELLIICHHAILIPPIFLWLNIWPGLMGILWSLVGFFLVLYTAFWVAILVAIIAVRFPDFVPILQSLLRLAFFATPVIWVERNLGDFAQNIVLLNPFGYYIRIVRDPLLGLGMPFDVLFVALTMSAVITMISLFVFSKTLDRLTYWL